MTMRPVYHKRHRHTPPYVLTMSIFKCTIYYYHTLAVRLIIFLTMSGIRSTLSSWYAHGLRHPRKSLVAIAILLGSLFLTLTAGDTAEAPSSEQPSEQVVTLVSVAEASAEDRSLSLTGEVRSVSQAELRTRKSGTVTAVHARAGEYVQAGVILAEIDNAGERAAVLSAQGALAAAQAQLDRVRAGDRAEDKASTASQSESAASALLNAQDRARTTYSQSYTLAHDAVFAQADDFFSNPYTVAPSFRVRSASYDERKTLEKERVAIGALLEKWKEKSQMPIADDQLISRLTEAERDLGRIKVFLDNISLYVSEQELSDDLTSGEKAAEEGAILGARTAVDSARTAVNGARAGITSAQSAAEVTRLAEQKTTAGARVEDVRIAEAGVLQARGALQSAQAAFENSIIRTPIAGTVTTLNISRGDFVSSMVVAAIVANEKALEVELFVSENTRARIEAGQPVLVGGTHAGVITGVAPGLDPETKKARVTVGVSSDAPLTNGSYVDVTLMNSTSSTTTRDASTDGYLIPLSAIKVLPDGLAVFTVGEDETLLAHAIQEGTITGDRMLVRDIAPELRIVVDVRGLQEGDRVSVTR